MAASYPTTVKVWSPTDTNFAYPEDLKTVVYARHVVSLYDEVTAIEQQLGAGGVATSNTWGAGTFSSATTAWGSLRARVQNIEDGVYESVNYRVSARGGSVVTPSTASVVGVTVKAASSQTANLLELRNSSNSVVTAVGKDGWILTIDGGSAV